jgi:organic radical activating enzyme
MTSQVGAGSLCEIFSGIQGEGLYVGCRQVFIRLYGCNLGCRYCDTSYAHNAADKYRIETSAGSRNFASGTNPVSAQDIVSAIAVLASGKAVHHSISITGGEPLFQHELVRTICTGLKEHGQTTFLETNGTLPWELAQVIDYADIISMDIKLPSVTGEDGLMPVHAEFLEIAQRRNVYVKTVVAHGTTDEEIQEMIGVMVNAPSVPLIIQPASPVGGVLSPMAEQLLRWQEMCMDRLSDVRVIPQCHKIMGQM